MKRLITILVLMQMLSCQDEPTSKENILIGDWDSYESGNEQSGFTEHITNGLLLSYESGVTFCDKGTFGPRYFLPESGKWDFFTIEEPGTWSGGCGHWIYELNGNTISLTYFPGTPDESKSYLHIVKLDERHLWFRHSIFGDEIEHHLVRHD